MRQRVLRTVSVFVAIGSAIGCARPASHASAAFPAGQPIRIVVGYAAGGGYDVGARLVARHLGRNLPGSPTVIVENMPGAGGVIAARHLATVARPDGLTIGFIAANSFIGDGGSLPAFDYLGSPGPVVPVCVFTRASGIHDLDTWRRAPHPPRVGSTGPGSISYVAARLVQSAASLPLRMIAGYAGSAELRLALSTGELEGLCATWETLEGPVRQGRELVPVLRLSERPIQDFESLPDARDLASDERGRRLLDAGIYAANSLGRVFVAPPGADAGVIAILRTALARTFADADFLRDAATAHVDVAPLSARDLEAASTKMAADRQTRAALTAVLAAR